MLETFRDAGSNVLSLRHTKGSQAREVAQLVGTYLAYTRFWVQFSAYVHHLKTWEVGARGFEIQSYPCLHCEFETNLC